VDRLYRLRRGARLYSFGDPIQDVPILGVRLAETQAAAARAVGAEIVDVATEDEISEPRYLVFDEGLYLSPRFLDAALAAFRAAPGSRQAAVSRNPYNDSVVLPTGEVPPAEWRLGLVSRDRSDDVGSRGREQGGPGEGVTAESTVLVEQHILGGQPTGLPEHLVPSAGFQLHLSDCFAAPVPTPFHLLHVNVAALLSRFAEGRRRWPEWLVRLVAAPRSRGFYRALRRMNRIGRGCRIHPTAVLEGVTLGDGVTVGAHAVVRLAQIGAGSTLEDQCSVTLSVLGENNYIANKNHITYSMSYDDVFAIHGPYQFSVFGRRTAVFAVIACDVRLDGGTITMPTACGVIDSNRHLLGNAYGHDVKVGGGNIIAPGRIVPNGLHLPPPSNILYSFSR